MEMVENESSFSVDTYLEQLLGRRYREPAYSWSITIVYCVIFITGLTGNICTLLVIAKTSKMYTATNCYLFSLAISDTLTLLLGMPPEFYLVWVQYPWPFGNAYCVFKSFISELTSYASVLTILLFTVERWLAICYPMKSQLISGVHRSIKILVCIWISALLCAAPYARLSHAFYAVEYPSDCAPQSNVTFTFGRTHSNQSVPHNVNVLQQVIFSRYDFTVSASVTTDCASYGNENRQGPIPESLTCSIAPEFAQLGNILLQCSTCIFFVAPMIIITVLYVRIAVTLRGADSIFARTSTKRRAKTGAGHRAAAIVCVDKQDSESSTQETSQSRGRRENNGNTNDLVRPGARKEPLPNAGSAGAGHTRKAALRILIAVVIVFFLSYAPYHLQRIISVHHLVIPGAIHILDYLFQFSAVFYYVSSATNPILYNVASKRFRRAFMQVLCSCIRKSEPAKTKCDCFDVQANLISLPVPLDKKPRCARLHVHNANNANPNAYNGNTNVNTSHPSKFAAFSRFRVHANAGENAGSRCGNAHSSEDETTNMTAPAPSDCVSQAFEQNNRNRFQNEFARESLLCDVSKPPGNVLANASACAHANNANANANANAIARSSC